MSIIKLQDGKQFVAISFPYLSYNKATWNTGELYHNNIYKFVNNKPVAHICIFLLTLNVVLLEAISPHTHSLN